MATIKTITAANINDVTSAEGWDGTTRVFSNQVADEYVKFLPPGGKFKAEFATLIAGRFIASTTNGTATNDVAVDYEFLDCTILMTALGFSVDGAISFFGQKTNSLVFKRTKIITTGSGVKSFGNAPDVGVPVEFEDASVIGDANTGSSAYLFLRWIDVNIKSLSLVRCAFGAPSGGQPVFNLDFQALADGTAPIYITAQGYSTYVQTVTAGKWIMVVQNTFNGTLQSGTIPIQSYAHFGIKNAQAPTYLINNRYATSELKVLCQTSRADSAAFGDYTFYEGYSFSPKFADTNTGSAVTDVVFTNMPTTSFRLDGTNASYTADPVLLTARYAHTDGNGYYFLVDSQVVKLADVTTVDGTAYAVPKTMTKALTYSDTYTGGFDLASASVVNLRAKSFTHIITGTVATECNKISYTGGLTGTFSYDTNKEVLALADAGLNDRSLTDTEIGKTTVISSWDDIYPAIKKEWYDDFHIINEDFGLSVSGGKLHIGTGRLDLDNRSIAKNAYYGATNVKVPSSTAMTFTNITGVCCQTASAGINCNPQNAVNGEVNLPKGFTVSDFTGEVANMGDTVDTITFDDVQAVNWAAHTTLTVAITDSTFKDVENMGLADHTFNFTRTTFSGTATTAFYSNTATVNILDQVSQTGIGATRIAAMKTAGATVNEYVVGYTVAFDVPSGSAGYFAMRNTRTNSLELAGTFTNGVLTYTTGSAALEIKITDTDTHRVCFKITSTLGLATAQWYNIKIQDIVGTSISGNITITPSDIPLVFTDQAIALKSGESSNDVTLTFAAVTTGALTGTWANNVGANYRPNQFETLAAVLDAMNSTAFFNWHVANEHSTQYIEVSIDGATAYNNSVPGISGVATADGIFFKSTSASDVSLISQATGFKTPKLEATVGGTTVTLGADQVVSEPVGDMSASTARAVLVDIVDDAETALAAKLDTNKADIAVVKTVVDAIPATIRANPPAPEIEKMYVRNSDPLLELKVTRVLEITRDGVPQLDVGSNGAIHEEYPEHKYSHLAMEAHSGDRYKFSRALEHVHHSDITAAYYDNNPAAPAYGYIRTSFGSASETTIHFKGVDRNLYVCYRDTSVSTNPRLLVGISIASTDSISDFDSQIEVTVTADGFPSTTAILDREAIPINDSNSPTGYGVEYAVSAASGTDLRDIIDESAYEITLTNSPPGVDFGVVFTLVVSQFGSVNISADNFPIGSPIFLQHISPTTALDVVKADLATVEANQAKLAGGVARASRLKPYTKDIP